MSDLRALREWTGLDLEEGRLLREGPRATVWWHPLRSGGAVVVKRYADSAAATAVRERRAYAALGARSLPLPRCLAIRDGLLVLEALDGEGLPASPEATDPRDLHRVAAALGSLHAEARGIDLEGPSGTELQAQALRDALPAISAFVAQALGVVPSGMEDALARLADSLAHTPSEACTLTLGDLAPSNVLVSPSGVGFVDLEYAARREPFYDAMFWRAIVPLPRQLSRALDQTYRDALADGGWTFDDEAFAEGRARTAAHRVYWTLSWGLLSLFERDWPVVPGGPGMRRVLHGILGQLVEVAGPLEAPLRSTAQDLRLALGARWELG